MALVIRAMADRTMRKSGRSSRRKTRQSSEERQILLDQLKEAASVVGVEVREEKLSRGLGYSVRSGPCRVDGREVVFLDSVSTVDERIEVMLDVLSGRDLGGVWLEPRLRRLIEGADPGAGKPADTVEPS